jgi:hypothetical protein
MKTWLALLCLSLTACTTVVPQLGASEQEAILQMRPLTARYAMPDGGVRLEFARGPYGRETWMIDVDNAGRVVAVQQVLGEAKLAEFQKRAPGMSRDELLRTLGTPGEKRSGGWQPGQVWSWRFPTNDCLWFQVSMGDDGVVKDGAFAIDPICDAPNDKGQ